MAACHNSRGLQYEQCVRWLASTLQLQTGSDRGAQLQLDNCWKAVQGMLQSAVVHGMPLPVGEAQRIQAVLAQLLTVCFLQSKAMAQPNLPQSSQAQQQLLAQVVAVAAELQQVLGGRSLDHRAALAAYNMRNVGGCCTADAVWLLVRKCYAAVCFHVTSDLCDKLVMISKCGAGCHCQAMFELLLSSEVSSSLPPNSQEAELLWTTLYQAAVSCIPKGEAQVCAR